MSISQYQPKANARPQAGAKTTTLEAFPGLLESVLCHCQEYVYVKDYTGQFLLVNDAYAAFLGVDNPQVIQGRREEDYFPSDFSQDSLRAERQVLQSGCMAPPRERWYTSAVGAKICLVITLIPLGSVAQPAVAVLGIARNVTSERVVERQLEELQKLSTISALAGGIAHEYNNLLTGVLGYTELLAGRTAGDALSQKYVEQIKRATDEASELTHQLSAFSETAVIQPARLSFVAMLQEACQLLTPSIGASIRFIDETPDFVAMIEGDAQHLRQAMIALLLNAAESMSVGGAIRLHCESIEIDDRLAQKLGLVKAGTHYRLVIQDKGLGMDPATQRRMFEPFFTTKSSGHSGLGLSTALSIIRKHDGALDVSSEPGKGTTVMLYLPAIASTDPQPAGESDAVPLDGRTVLLVEDEEIPRQLQAHTLQSAGFCVLAANDGTQGLDLFHEYANEIDLVVTDIVMPRMSGDLLVSEIRKSSHPVKILAVSGYAGREAASRLRDLGVNGFLQKPFTGQLLLDRVRQVLTS